MSGVLRAKLLKRFDGKLLQTPFTPTRITSQDKHLSTPDLLIKLGYIRQPHAGVTQWLPLGQSVLKNIENVIHNRLKENGSIEVSLSHLSHRELWEKTGRWSDKTMFAVNDQFCLAPTCEEEITDLAKSYFQSYKKLPVTLYQIGRKYRNELRPRGGILRGREFVMKDAYSFDQNDKDAIESFENMNHTYELIFQDLKVDYVKAKADSGEIGGDMSLEWHILDKSGEDTLFTCDNQECKHTSNIECATFEPPVDENTGEVVKCESAEAKYFLTKDNKTLIVAYFPKGRTLIAERLLEEIDDLNLQMKSKNDQDIVDIYLDESNGTEESKYVIRIMDPQVQAGTDLPDLLIRNYARSRLTTLNLEYPITETQEGDLCSECEGQGTLISSRGIEVGHTFHLGDKYSKPLDATFSDKEGKQQYYSMGCYGIGVSRLVGAIAEASRDDVGLRWPARLAPCQVSIIVSKNLEEELDGDVIADHLIGNYTVDIGELNDESVPSKLNRSKTIGIPIQVVLGRMYPKVEIEVRGKLINQNGDYSYEYEKLREKQEFEWVIEDQDSNKKRDVKHIVDIKDARKVIEALLKDL